VKHAEGALVSQTARQDLGIDFDLVAEQHGAPVDVLSAEDHRLLIFAVLDDCHVNRLVKFE